MEIKKKYSNIVIGALFILLGILLLLGQFGIINLSNFSSLLFLWPVLIVFSGLLLVFRRYLLSIFILILAVFLGATNGIVEYVNSDEVEIYSVNKTVLLNDTANVEINFGLGKLDIKSNNLSNQMNLNYNGIPNYNIKNDNDWIEISNIREDDNFFENFRGIKNNPDTRLEMALSKNVLYNLSINNGLSESYIDLRDLNVDYLDIDNGLSETTIYLGNKLNKANINTGLSGFNLYYSNESSILINVDAEVVEVDLEGFRKEGRKYYSKNFNSSKFSEINIEAGASDIRGYFFK